jgi:hypothetical protein
MGAIYEKNKGRTSCPTVSLIWQKATNSMLRNIAASHHFPHYYAPILNIAASSRLPLYTTAVSQILK